MSGTGALNRLQQLQNENATNINPAKNHPINQAPKSALKDLTNAKKGLGNILGGKPGSSFRTPQIHNKKETKVKEKEVIQVYLDDFCTVLPKKYHEFPEMKWTSIDTEKLASKLAAPMESECLGYEHFKDDEFVMMPISDPEPPECFEDLDVTFDIDWTIPEMEPMKVPDLDFDFI